MVYQYFDIFLSIQDVSVLSELKRRSQLREMKKEKDKELAAKAKKSSSNKLPSSASRKRLTPTETPKGQGGSDDVDEVRTKTRFVFHLAKYSRLILFLFYYMVFLDCPITWPKWLNHIQF